MHLSPATLHILDYRLNKKTSHCCLSKNVFCLFTFWFTNASLDFFFFRSMFSGWFLWTHPLFWSLVSNFAWLLKELCHNFLTLKVLANSIAPIHNHPHSSSGLFLLWWYFSTLAIMFKFLLPTTCYDPIVKWCGGWLLCYFFFSLLSFSHWAVYSYSIITWGSGKWQVLWCLCVNDA